METNYIIILSYTTAEVIYIKLSDEQRKRVADCDDMEAFIAEEFPQVDLSNALFMCVPDITETKIGF